jgi:hypothetical protein
MGRDSGQHQLARQARVHRPLALRVSMRAFVSGMANGECDRGRYELFFAQTGFQVCPGRDCKSGALRQLAMNT